MQLKCDTIDANMADPLHKASWLDPSKKAGSVLDYVLDDTSDESVAARTVQSSVTEELQKAPVLLDQSARAQSRVLFITRDMTTLQNDSIAQLHFKSLGSMFQEVHVMVLAESWQAKRGVDRIEKNVWMYSTSAKYWWMQPFIASSVSHQQLRFNGGFRPDVIVALDPFESGVVGLYLASKYDREFQLHVSEDFFNTAFIQKEKDNKWRLKMAAYTFKRTQSVRVATMTLKEQIEKKYKHIQDLALLPRHYNIRGIIEATEKAEVVDAFPQFSFVALYVGKLDYESTLFRAIDAVRTILRSPAISFVVLGDGPHKKEFQTRAEILGIKERVVFYNDQSRLLQFLRSADILIATDTTEASDEIVIKAAAAGLPILGARTELRDDLFTDGESAFLCEKEDTVGFSQKLLKFLNANSLRTQFATNAKDIIKTRLHEDPDAYTLAYRDSIEQVFIEEPK